MSPTDAPTATLFDIQHFSLNDGPGIRTTLFFKGCPLRCLWCHNPESYRDAAQLAYHAQLCTGCGMCAEVCPTHAHQVQNGLHTVDFHRCTACGACVDICCYDALQLSGKAYTAEELFESIRPDIPYFQMGKERGGITLSGGEPMRQVAFLRHFLPQCGGIHICMETCGFAAQDAFAGILEYVDLFLFDYKATGPEEHTRLCGEGNRQILENLEFLYRSGKQIILRLPLVPGVNDTEAHLRGAAALLRAHPRIQRAEIMAYHTLGDAKAQQHGMRPALTGISVATQADKERWISCFQSANLPQPVVLG